MSSYPVEQRVRLDRWVWALTKSWLEYFLAVGILVAILAGGYVLIAWLVPGALGFFEVALMIAASIVTLLVIFNEWLVVWAMGAQRIRTREQNPRLWDSVERTSRYLWARPRIYWVPVSGMNAFAFGLGLPFLSAVGATRGLVNRLNDDQLDAVMAHEAGHINNKDIILSMSIMFLVMMITTTGYLMHNFWPFGISGGSKGKDDKSGWLATIFKIIILPIIGWVLYELGRALGPILSAFVSRAREYGADAYSAHLMGSGDALAEALTIVVGDPSIGDSTTARLVGFLCTADPDRQSLLATHPSLTDRIRALHALEG